MKNGLTRRQRKRVRSIRLQRIRERLRLSRKGKFYNPDIQNFSSPSINKNFHAKDPRYLNNVQIKLHKNLNFSDEVVDTLKIIRKIRNEILYGESKGIFIDQSELEEISPDAAIVLLAELHRSMSYASEAKRVRSNYPKNEYATKMLDDIGFYNFLNIPNPKINKGGDLRTYFKVRTGRISSGKIVGGLIRYFESVIKFDELARKRLYAALVECMDNVRAHAYQTKSDSPDLIGEWWMAGFCDAGTGQVAFIFLDQGVGIPTTLKSKHSVRIKKLLSWTQSKMIEYAVVHGLTRRRSARHGNGLPSLREFIDVSSAGGFLRVLSNNGDFTYYKNHRNVAEDNDEKYIGTLILWSMQLEKEMYKSGSKIDFRDNNAQLRFEL